MNNMHILQIILAIISSFLLGMVSMELFLSYKAKREESKLHDDMSKAFGELQGKINQL